ncbi:MAG: phenylalanine--tRNA ligase beta subunit-related protein [Breoghania sp.]|nr:phenylalanine--tRNA ligase beta subunit-related protein [Breoghania sp.]
MVGGASIQPRSADLAQEIASRGAEFRNQWGAAPLSEIPGIKVWRAAYRVFGIKKTSYRCSVEWLAKNAQAERPMPEINAFVDAYNAVSLSHVMPLGADDLDCLSGDIAFRYAREGDDFRNMGVSDENGNPGPRSQSKTSEVVYADGEKILCRRWNWRQDGRSLVTAKTSRAVVTVQLNGAGVLEDAVSDRRDMLQRHCGGTSVAVIADAANSVVDLPGI